MLPFLYLVEWAALKGQNVRVGGQVCQGWLKAVVGTLSILCSSKSIQLGADSARAPLLRLGDGVHHLVKHSRVFSDSGHILEVVLASAADNLQGSSGILDRKRFELAVSQAQILKQACFGLADPLLGSLVLWLRTLAQVGKCTLVEDAVLADCVFSSWSRIEGYVVEVKVEALDPIEIIALVKLCRPLAPAPTYICLIKR